MAEFSVSISDLKKYDYYRYLCCLLSPEHLQPRFFAIYAFNNEIAKIKDVISEPMAGHIRLQWWRDAIEEIYNGRPESHNHHVVRDLYKVISQVDVPKDLFDNLIDAREADIEFSMPEDIASIENYAVGTSSRLFELLLAAAEINDKHAREAAHYAGIAYAITGIMRSMKFSAYRGRVILPKDLLDKASISEDDIINGRYLGKTNPIVHILCDKIEVNLTHVRALLKEAPRFAINVFLPLSVVDIFLARIRKNSYDIFYSDIESGRLRLQLNILKSKIFGSI
jgi:NADH dehydrogenase [ubiquinone] 1 alpha subcomplex assembly factor 6